MLKDARYFPTQILRTPISFSCNTYLVWKEGKLMLWNARMISRAYRTRASNDASGGKRSLNLDVFSRSGDSRPEPFLCFFYLGELRWLFPFFSSIYSFPTTTSSAPSFPLSTRRQPVCLIHAKFWQNEAKQILLLRWRISILKWGSAQKQNRGRRLENKELEAKLSSRVSLILA